MPQPEAPAAVPRRHLWRAFGRGVVWWLGTLFALGGTTALLGATAWVVLYWHFADGYPIRKTVVEDRSLPFLSINHRRLHLVAHGPGGTAPLVVGVPNVPWGDGRELHPLLRLKDTAQVVLYDARGTGLSERIVNAEDPCTALSLDSLAADLYAVIRHYAPRHRPVWLVCQGDGWRVAQRMLARAPGGADSVLHGGGIVLLAAGEPAGGYPRPPLFIDQPEFAFRLYYEPLHIRTLGDAHSRPDHRSGLWRAAAPPPVGFPQAAHTTLAQPWRTGATAAGCLARELKLTEPETLPLGIRILNLQGAANGPGGEISNAALHPLVENPLETVGRIRQMICEP